MILLFTITKDLREPEAVGQYRQGSRTGEMQENRWFFEQRLMIFLGCSSLFDVWFAPTGIFSLLTPPIERAEYLPAPEPGVD